MPLQVSHIKFALDLQDYFKPHDLKQYLIGAVYPDSRYASGLDRLLTHNKDFWPEKFWVADDFKKGWASHAVSDKAYVFEAKKIFNSWGDLCGALEIVENAAVKIVGDILILKDLNILEKLDIIKKLPNPNNESVEKMKDFLRDIKNCYKNGAGAKIADYFPIMKSSFGENFADKIIKQADIFMNDEKIRGEIENLFINSIRFRAIALLEEVRELNNGIGPKA